MTKSSWADVAALGQEGRELERLGSRLDSRWIFHSQFMKCIFALVVVQLLSFVQFFVTA